MIKFSVEKPPVYERCKDMFGIEWDKNIIITYGDTIHCKIPISPDLKVHETTHVKQQLSTGKDIWWEKYFTDKSFRLSQELEAYRNQLTYVNKNYNRKARVHIKKHIIYCMPNLYGNMCTKKEAEKMLNDL